MLSRAKYANIKHWETAEMGGKLQVWWNGAPSETVPCLLQDMQRMWKDQPLQCSVQVDAMTATGSGNLQGTAGQSMP